MSHIPENIQGAILNYLLQSRLGEQSRQAGLEERRLSRADEQEFRREQADISRAGRFQEILLAAANRAPRDPFTGGISDVRQTMADAIKARQDVLAQFPGLTEKSKNLAEVRKALKDTMAPYVELLSGYAHTFEGQGAAPQAETSRNLATHLLKWDPVTPIAEANKALAADIGGKAGGVTPGGAVSVPADKKAKKEAPGFISVKGGPTKHAGKTYRGTTDEILSQMGVNWPGTQAGAPAPGALPPPIAPPPPAAAPQWMMGPSGPFQVPEGGLQPDPLMQFFTGIPELFPGRDQMAGPQLQDDFLSILRSLGEAPLTP